MFCIAAVLLSIDKALCIGDSNGKVYIVDTSQILEGKYSIEELPGGHLTGHKADLLITLKGKVNTEGFLSSVGVTAIDEQTEQYSMHYVSSFPCTVLMSIGIGFQDSFTQSTNNSTCFITWVLPCSKLYG